MSDVEYHLRQAEAAARLALVEPDPAMAITLHVLALEQYEKAEKAESDRVPGSGVTGGGTPRSPARAGLVSWR